MKYLSAQKGMLIWSVFLLLFIFSNYAISQDPPAPYNLQCEIIGNSPGVVSLTWDYDPDTTTTFQFFIIMRDGAPVGTSSTTAYIDTPPPGYGTFCYTVRSYYNGGYGISEPSCITIYPAPYNVYAIFNNDLIPIVDISWDHDTDSVQHFIVERDGFPIGTTTQHHYQDQTPTFINYCYTITAVYNSGNSVPSDPGCSNPNPLLPEMFVTPKLGYYWVLAGNTHMWNTNIFNIGDWVLWYQFQGFTPTSSPPGFISDVSPSIAFVGEGTIQDVTITWSTDGYTPGTYYQNLVVIGSDPNNMVEVITNIMQVGPFAFLEGDIVDASNNEPLYGVEINAVNQYDQTDTSGNYLLRLPPNTSLDVTYEKPGYESLVIPVTTGDDWMTMVIDTSLVPIGDIIPWVLAETDCNDPSPAEISWPPPGQMEELLYDDGFCTDFHAWDFPGGEHAVQFTPTSYPAVVSRGSFFVGRGEYPIGNWLNTSVSVLVYDVGPDGMPGDVLDSTTTTINDYGWVDCFFANGAQIDSGSFFIAIVQENMYPNTPPIGVDSYQDQFNYSYSKPPLGNWDTAGFRNFMIRAIIEYPSGDGVDYYTIARIQDLDPDIGPQNGTHVLLGNVVGNQYTDNMFQYLNDDWYAYAVQTVYSSGQSDPFVYSNIIGHDMGKIVELIAEDCNGNPVESIEIQLSGQDYPYELYNEVDTSPIIFDCVWKGAYDISVIAPGFDTVQFNTEILADTSFYFMFDSTIYPVSNLWVDTINLIAYWDPPTDTSGLMDYSVYLDGQYSGNTDSTYYQFTGLPFDQYTVCVEANYACGPSDPVCTNFGGGYLQAPDWITGDSIGNDILLTWYYNDTTGHGDAMIGFKLYRDSVYFKYIEYLPGQDTYTYLDTNLAPMCYDYHVSAFYTLEPFGYYMQFGDSEFTGPAEVCLVGGDAMPIFEDWSSGSFGTFWTPEGNWRVNGQYGNPKPSAEFTWDLIYEDYQFSLTTDFINGVYMDSTKQEYLDGKFMLNFDMKLDDNSSSGTEYFKAEIWSEGIWHTVLSADNSNGSFGWTTETIDITDYAFGSVFKLRFQVEGENTMNILSWFVDNIEVYHYCAAPVDLTEGIHIWPDTCEMFWYPPNSSKDSIGLIEDYSAYTNLNKGVQGYNVYVMFNGNQPEFTGFTEDTTFSHGLTEYGIYEYYVTTVYESCESSPSNTFWIEYKPWEIEDNSKNDLITVFPNPAKNEISIVSQMIISQLCLLDLSGRELYCKENIHEKQHSLNVSGYDPGVYLLRIDTEQGRVVRKIVIAR